MIELTELVDTFYVGIDVHKYTHTAVMIDCFNRVHYTKDFTNAQISCVLEDIQKLLPDKKIIFGLEDTKGNGRNLSKYIIQKGFTVFAVPPIMVDRHKDRSTHKEKSDHIDAKGVAEVILFNQKTVPLEIISQESEIAIELNGLISDRDQLTKSQTQVKNQLHVLLHQLLGDEYRSYVSTKNIFTSKGIRIYQEKLQGLNTTDSKRALRKIKELTLIQEQIKEVDIELKEVSKNSKQVNILEKLNGCGNLTACRITAAIKDIRRFSSKSKLARYAGLAPKSNSSAGKGKSKTDLQGNRKLNHGIHRIALSLLGNKGTEEAKEYYQRKKSEGKSSLHAMRCLKRQIVNRIFRELKDNLT